MDLIEVLRSVVATLGVLFAAVLSVRLITEIIKLTRECISAMVDGTKLLDWWRNERQARSDRGRPIIINGTEKEFRAARSSPAAEHILLRMRSDLEFAPPLYLKLFLRFSAYHDDHPWAIDGFLAMAFAVCLIAWWALRH